MTREAKILWVAFAVLCGAFVLLVLSSCGNSVPEPKRVEVLSCLEIANAALEKATSCEEARAVVDRIVKQAPMCLRLFGAQVNMASDAGTMVPCEQL